MWRHWSEKKEEEPNTLIHWSIATPYIALSLLGMFVPFRASPATARLSQSQTAGIRADGGAKTP